jgi:RsiW-degrading membrane proteinase PrsW (M82 family)
MVWGKYLGHMNAFSSDKNNEHKYFWFVMAGNIISMMLIFIIYPLWQTVLPNLTGLKLSIEPFEELSKFIFFISLSALFKSIKTTRDGMLQAASIALGFALGENFLFVMDSRISLLIYKFFFGVLGSIVFALIWGYTWTVIVSVQEKKRRYPSFFYVLISLTFSIVFHGVYNYFLAIGHPWFALLTILATLVLSFTVYLYVKEHSLYRKYPVEKYRSAVLGLQVGGR